MLPCVSAPMAASTWLGSSALDVQADPEPTAKPRASSAVRSASPSTYRHENVRTWGRRSTGCPTTSTSGTSAATRVRSVSTSRRRAASSCALVETATCSATAAASAAGTLTPPGNHRSSSSGQSGERRTAGPRHEDPEPARAAPVARVRREQVPGVADVDVAEARARVHQQRDTRGARGVVHGADGLQRAHLAVRVLERGERHARTGERGRELLRRRPDRPGRRATVARSPAKSAALQHRRALDRADDDLRPGPATPAGDGPDGAVQRRGVRRGQVDLGRPGADRRGDRLARTVQQHPRPTALGVQAPRVRPALVEGLEERGARLRAAAGARPPASRTTRRAVACVTGAAVGLSARSRSDGLLTGAP